MRAVGEGGVVPSQTVTALISFFLTLSFSRSSQYKALRNTDTAFLLTLPVPPREED